MAWLTDLKGFSVDLVDRVGIVHKYDRVELSLAKPGGGEASPRGEASRESGVKLLTELRGYTGLTELTGLAWLTDLKGFSVDLVDRVGIVHKYDRVDRVDTVDGFSKGDRADRVNIVGTVSRVDKFDS